MGKAYTYTSRYFAGRVTLVNGKKKIAIKAPLYYDAEVAKFKVGDEVSITLTNRKPKRTESQNNYWWGVYLPAILAAGKGSGSALETHEDLARKFLTIKEWRNSKGQLCYIRASTAELTVGGFCEFIANVQEETGVAAPPTENFDLAPLKAQPKSHGKTTRDEGGKGGTGTGGDDSAGDSEAVPPSPRAPKRSPKKEGGRRAPRKRGADAASDGAESPRGH